MCAQALHRSHAPPSGAHLTGDFQNGFTLHLRPAYSTPEHVQGLRRWGNCRILQEQCTRIWRTAQATCWQTDVPAEDLCRLDWHAHDCITSQRREVRANFQKCGCVCRFMELCNMGAGGLMAGGANNHQRNSSAPAGTHTPIAVCSLRNAASM